MHDMLRFYMPTRVCQEPDCVARHADALAALGAEVKVSFMFCPIPERSRFNVIV